QPRQLRDAEHGLEQETQGDQLRGDIANEGQDHAQRRHRLDLRPVALAEQVSEREYVEAVQRSYQEQTEEQEAEEATERVLNHAEQAMLHELRAGTEYRLGAVPQREQRHGTEQEGQASAGVDE